MNKGRILDNPGPMPDDDNCGQALNRHPNRRMREDNWPEGMLEPFYGLIYPLGKF